MSFQVRRVRDSAPQLEEKKVSPRIWRKLFFASLQIAGPALKLFVQWNNHRKEETHHRHRVRILKRVLLVLVALLAVLLLVSTIVHGILLIRTVGIGTVAQFTISGADPPKDRNGFTNILLLGQGDAAGQDLTDSVMLASLDPETRSTVLLSIPRDIYFLETERMGKGKMNSRYRDYRSYLRFQQGMEEEKANAEALQELTKEIGRKLSVDIHGAVKIDFEGFIKAVDALGGVEIDVPQDIVDTTYPDNNYGYETFEIRKGLQQLDGTTALKYARSRHTTSDFSRSARQQQMLAALAAKAKSIGVLGNPRTVAELLRIAKEHVLTTFSMSELVGIVQTGRSIDRTRIITMQLNDRNGLYGPYIEPGGILYTPPRNQFGGASVLLPVSIPEFPVTWKQPRALVRLLLHQREAYITQPKISLLNAGAPSGTARRLANELKRFGFNVTNIANASSGEQETTTVSTDETLENEVADFFAQLLRGRVATTPADLPEEEQANITIILGSDFPSLRLQDLVPHTS